LRCHAAGGLDLAAGKLDSRLAARHAHSFGENLLGRPRFPEWDELVDSEMADTARPGAQVTKTDSELRIDFGPDGGLSVITRFDDVACQVTFSYVKDARASEGVAWEEIIASVERTSLAT